ncbi:MAG: tetratricopeptide repeat protein [Alphaproteobacteria bacterium]|nr:tetratricopeptide repeat protein [Alphaproteobacteria bacterium]
MNFISRKLKTLLLILFLISGVIVASGWVYYRELNRAEDPRIIEARKIMVKYNNLMSENETDLALLVLDQVEDIYRNTSGYADSYEIGVVLNNRGSVFLIKVETDIINQKEPHIDNFTQAKQYLKSSIDVYTNWLEKIESMEREDVYNMILPFFSENDPAFDNLDLEKIIEKRIDDIVASKIETGRRLSVSYTNLGIVYRYEGNLENAMEQYEKALALWPDNHVAKNNLNQLLGFPLEKRNIIKQMFFEEKT